MEYISKDITSKELPTYCLLLLIVLLVDNLSSFYSFADLKTVSEI